MRDRIGDAVSDLRDVDALKRYLRENRARVVPVAVAVLLLVAGAAFAVSSFTEDHEQSLQVDVETADQDPGIARVDSDDDNLSDLQEVYRFGTDPTEADTDGDGIPDGWEAEHRIYDEVSNTYRINPLVNDSTEDVDGDGLTNLEEHECGSDPTLPDTDGDGLPDAFECRYGLDPRSPDEADTDEDGDGLTLREEAEFGTDPTSADTDGDGLTDPQELRELPTDPTRYSTAGHGISDGYLVEHDINATDAGVAFSDPDGDGLTTRGEFRASRDRFNPTGDTDVREDYASWLDPTDPDTDGDGMADGWEVRHRLDPLDPSDASGDFDDDGLTNVEEFQAGADPRREDSDGDGLTDPEEVRQGWTVTVDGEEKQVFSDPGKADSDQDFLSDPAERRGSGTVDGSQTEFCPDGPCPLDPMSPDTDLDGLSDSFEVSYEVEPRLDPTLPDTDGDGLLDKEEFDLWQELRSTTSQDEVTRIRAQGDLASCDGVEADTLGAVRAAVGPQGDLDGDGLANLVDADADCDGLSDGEEVDPPRKEATPGSRDTRPLPRTSPALIDTDGDGLPDDWENKFARFDFGLGDWNLNASKEDSLERNDGKTDADRDLDDDGIEYEDGYVRPRDYSHTNIQEFEAGTDPNDPDTDGDGLPDGWEFRFNRIALSQGASVNLDPLDPDDADRISKQYEFVRFAERGTPEAELREEHNETEAGGTENIVRIEGRFDVTYLDEFEAKTDPTLADTDGDGLPDAWELYYLAQTGDDASFSPTEPSAGRDFDGDGLTNIQEYEAQEEFGTPSSPIKADTDLGGIPDDKEVNQEAGGSPLNPEDDNPHGDIDNDGYSNVCELRPASERCTGPAPSSATDPIDFDTDGDGLLDGPDRQVGGGVADDFRAEGIVSATVDGQTVFLGEADREPPTDPNVLDSTNDGMPDGWLAFYAARHGLDPSDNRNDDDALSDLAEYEVGLPDDWSLDEDGVWWFGADPTAVDTDGDGAEDGAVDPDAGSIRGQDLDYDNDGLNDFTGEDPEPFLDFDNDGAESARDPDLVRSWVWEDGRSDLNTSAVAPDDIVVARQMASPAITDVSVTYPDSEKTLRKGSHVTVEGRLEVDGAAVPNAPVLANLFDGSGLRARGAPGQVLDVAFTDADGTFELQVALEPQRTTNVTAPNVLFGQRHEATTPVSWDVNTTAHPPGFDYRIVVWNYGISPMDGEDRGYDYETTVDGETVPAPGVEGTFADPHVHDDPITVRSGSQWQTPDRFDLENAGTLSGSVVLADSVGDPLVDQDVRLSFRDRTITGTTDSSGTFEFETETDPFDTPGTRELTLSYDGTDLVDDTETTVPVRVRFPTTLEAEVASESLSTVAGGSLPVEGRVLDSRDEPVEGPVTVAFAGQSVQTNTSSDGRFFADVPVSEGVSVGNRKVTARFDGTSTHLPDETEVGIVQIRQVARVNVDVEPASLGEPVEVAGELRDLADRPVRDPTADDALEVDLVLGDTTVTAAVDNETSAFSATIPAGAVPEPGNLTLEATFGGSSLYGGHTNETSLFVVSGTGIQLPSKNIVRGHTATLEGALLDARGQAVPNATVEVLFRSEHLANVTTDDDGRFEAEAPIPPDFPLGTALVEARFTASDDPTLRSASPAQTFYRVRTPTTLDVGDRVVPTGPIPVNGTLEDDRDRPVVGADINVSFGSRTERVFTDFGGRFEAVFDGADMKPRNVTVVVSYPGADRHAPASRTVDYQVVADTDLEIQRVSQLVRGDVAEVVGTLTTQAGHPVEGATVNVTVNDTVIDRATTDLDGRFRAEAGVPAELPTGPATLRIEYAGDANHDPSVRRIETRVKANPNIEVLVPDNLEVGDEFTGQVRVVDDQGNPIGNSEVQVQLSSLRYPFTLTTNETGWAEFPGRIQSPGSANVDVRFTGSQDTASSSSQAQITATETTFVRGGPPVAAAAVALLLLAAGVVGYLRWRRGVVTEAEEILEEATAQLAAGDEYSAVIMQTYRALADLVQRETDLEDRPELTASEFADAIEDTLPVREENLRTLVEIFEEARYSFHSVGPAQRDQAVANFRAIQRDLAEGTSYATAPEEAEGGEPA